MSGIIELLAEAPVFVAQVFCFVKLRVILDTLNIFVRSVIFITLVLRDPKEAIFAFSIAQVGSTVAFVIGYYVYFIHYIDKANKSRGAAKRTVDTDNGSPDKQPDEHTESDEFIPFNSILQMLPGCLQNPVSVKSHTNFYIRND